MDKDLDLELYNEYLKGEQTAFERLYLKYKYKIKYFVFNIVKDYDKAEDITQETFTYILLNSPKSNYSFKCYIYLIAKSRAITYLNKEKRRENIIKMYLSKEEKIENDVSEIIEKQEKKEGLLKAIDMLDSNYRNVIYLVKIEGLSYNEVSQILNISLQNVKNIIYRGKKQLRVILIKKGFDDMNKSLKLFFIVMIIGIVLSGVVYATVKIVESMKDKTEITPAFTSRISEIDTNKVWVGTFNLVWNDFMNNIIKGPIEFEDGTSKLAEELNCQSFTTEDLSENSYIKVSGYASDELKNRIESELKQKLNKESDVLDRINWNNKNSYILYAMLKKEFNYLTPFVVIKSFTFKESEKEVKYFCIDEGMDDKAGKNVDVLFYNSENDFAVQLKTKENEEVILYKSTGEGKSFEENYNELIEKNNNYKGQKNWQNSDCLKVPFISIKDEINYDELCGRYIKGTNGAYIKQAIQTIDFELNNKGGSIKSEGFLDGWLGISNIKVKRKFEFTSDFILFLKEKEKEKPYFALKIDNCNILVENN